MSRRLTTEEVIRDFEKVHGNKFDYSKSVYHSSSEKIIIICKIHGEFNQTPNSHKRGFGCTKCTGHGLNMQEHIKKFREVHGDTYDYSKSVYHSSSEKIIIICKIHGEFEQTPNSHKCGFGCAKCSGRGLSEQEYIKKFKKVHGDDTYGYSKFIYSGDYVKSIIICKIHGEFEQTPNSHKNGHGCAKCAGHGLNMQEHIKKFREVHGDTFDYSKSVYRSSSEKIIIICKIHGEFEQTPSSHKNGQGCQKCAGFGFNTPEHIEKFREIHGDTYDYSKSAYRSNHKKIIIVCKIHGEFEQTPHNHKRGAGCQKCTTGHGLNAQEIVDAFREVHGDTYDYSKSIYRSSSEKITIICKTHGEFEQTPSMHKSGDGCPKCKESVGEKKIRSFLTIKNVVFESQKKFKTCKNVNILAFDFHLPDHNTLIEFQGKQHYMAVEYFGGERGFLGVQKRDAIKRQWCLDNNVHLLEIRYDENVEERLTEFLDSRKIVIS
jgi:hypothetical protein